MLTVRFEQLKGIILLSSDKCYILLVLEIEVFQVRKKKFDGNSIHIKKILQEGVSEIYADKREENELNYVISSVVTNKQS